MGREFVYRNDSGVRRTMYCEDNLNVTVKTEVDMTSVIETNKVMRELHPTRSTNKLVARGVPMTVYEQSILEDWDDKRWNKWLNDPDNKVFRIWGGTV